MTHLIVGIVLLFGGIIMLASRGNKQISEQSPEQRDALAKEAKDFFATIRQTGDLPVSPSTSIILASGEKACLDEESNLYEEKSSRVYGGTGTRIEGIWVGGGGSTSIQSLRNIDSGRLTLTNKRIVFTGSMESRVIELTDIVSNVPLVDAIQIASKRRAKNQIYMVRNPILWATFIELIVEGTITFQKVPKADPTPVPEETKSEEPIPAVIKFNCPNCGQPIEAKAELAGKQAACPTCKTTLDVPVD
jgi:hypothetical protein